MEKKLRILVVDDEPTVRSALCRILVLQEMEVQDFGSAEEALAYLRESNNPRPDLIITDTNMPGMFGPKFLAAVRKDGLAPDAYYVIMSGAGHGDAEAVVRNGRAHAFMSKPWELAQLKTLIADVRARCAARAPSVDSASE